MTQSDTMTVEDFLGPQPDLLLMQRDATVQQAVEAMAGKKIGSTIVADAEGLAKGIFTERDVLCKVVALRRDPNSTCLADVMSGELMTCRPEEAVSCVQKRMITHNVRHMPVVKDGKAVGILSSRDIHLHHMSAMQGVAQKLHRVLEGMSEILPPS